MTIRVALHHKSHYVFDRAVTASPHEIRLRPAAHSRTFISGYSLKIRPEKHFIHWQQDAYGNFVARLTFPEPACEIDIIVDLLADMTVINPFDFFVESWAEHYPFSYPPTLHAELAPFLEASPAGPLLQAWLAELGANSSEKFTTINFLVMLNQNLHRRIPHLIRLEAGVQSCEETLEKKSGSCRDSAWLLVQTLRHFGIAARFVSGYLIQLASDEDPHGGPPGPDADSTDLHAWCEAYIPGAGWVGLDTTSGLLTGEGHIPLAVTAIPASAAPVSGSTGVCESRLDVEMTVTRIHEDPRATKPYSEEQWQAICALGQYIDEELQSAGVQLMQSGKLTFVSMDGDGSNSAANLQRPARMENCSTRYDFRPLPQSVMPETGVVGVTLAPSDSWKTLEVRIQSLYEEARLAGLTADKFMLDGRHTGTGGGNYIALGGTASAGSPFLRRPDLLKSLITYWQQHPALSYLFSGQFIGPNSQAPRVDESRQNNLYELEIAFQQMEKEPDSVDGCFRPGFANGSLCHLLTDLAGNMHRAEFCIDKLYSPDINEAHAGLLELRAFEMPPHYRMSLLQSLLPRILVARFWNKPYRGKLVYWDTALHDRFMLPHFVEQDMREICRDLHHSGYPVDDAWFAPFIEFRFPCFGSVVYEGVQMELRHALEPWGSVEEENCGPVATRYIDSSIERLQVKVTGMTDRRHQVICNGRLLPLHPTGVPGEFVAGVRFKAWALPKTLHPDIGVHAPLVFDLLDSWNGRSIGGCTYHVSHPGGRNYQTFPVNANEAEARRRARFWDHGHSPGAIKIKEEAVNPRFPMTLDLCRQAN